MMLPVQAKNMGKWVFYNRGYHAELGGSILLRTGYPSVYNVLGSVKAWVAAGFPVTFDEAFEH